MSITHWESVFGKKLRSHLDLEKYRSYALSGVGFRKTGEKITPKAGGLEDHALRLRFLRKGPILHHTTKV